MERGTPFAVLYRQGPIGVAIGRASVLGARLMEGGCNFAVYCPDAERVEVCLFDGEEEMFRIPMPGKTGRVWHCWIEGIQAGQHYGLRAYGHFLPDQGLYFDGRKLLIDPYARSLSRPLIWDRQLYRGDSRGMMPKCVVVDDDFHWHGVNKPHVPSAQTILYEIHVRGFTMQHPEIPEALRGTYLGLCHPATIAHLKALGVTTLQLMPVASFMTEPFLQERNRVNYWGYNPIAFFAPEPRYAVRDAHTEFKTMVRELHRNGLEVILDVVFNHSAEGGGDGPILSFRGLDNRNFYLYGHHADGSPDYRHYVNNTGCGNSINLDNPYVLQLVMDTLRYWVTEMQVDGFRFDLAVSLAREGNEFDHYSAFFKVVFQDPVLSRVKLIAEPWDIGMGGYRLGQFPTNWHECNDRFRDSVRGFWRGDRGLLGEVATRLLGSRDIFHKTLRSIYSSVNYITYHDGFTLLDLVSYSHKHNEANGEGNRDGHDHNLSCNHGVEGPTTDISVRLTRDQHRRNLLATLLLSVGTPHLLAGDELGHSQKGNNNAYCQDNPLGWLDWRMDDEQRQFLAAVRHLIRIRKRLQPITELNLQDDHYYGTKMGHTVRWYRPDGLLMSDDDWHNSERMCVLMEVICNEDPLDNQQLVLVINGSDQPQRCRLPLLHTSQCWQVTVDTARPDCGAATRRVPHHHVEVKRHSLLMVERISNSMI